MVSAASLFSRKTKKIFCMQKKYLGGNGYRKLKYSKFDQFFFLSTSWSASSWPLLKLNTVVVPDAGKFWVFLFTFDAI